MMRLQVIVGSAKVSLTHGFIVNVDHATTDYLNVIKHIQKQFLNSGIHLQTEVRIIGKMKRLRNFISQPFCNCLLQLLYISSK